MRRLIILGTSALLLLGAFNVNRSQVDIVQTAFGTLTDQLRQGLRVIMPGDTTDCTRARAVDGDTVKAWCGGEKVTVRLIGFDTPESKRPGVPVECLSRQAAKSLGRVVNGKAITLIADPSQDSSDRYGRRVAYVEVDGLDVGEHQLERGFARVYIYNRKPFSRYISYARAERHAKHRGAGIWSKCGGDNHRR